MTVTVEFLGVSPDPYGNVRAGFSAHTEISRRAFGIDFNVPFDGDKLLLGDTIEIHLEIQAVRKS